jgi:hypothetical protein
MAGAKITIFLPNGDPQSLRIAELSNWTGKALAAPRSDLDFVLTRKEVAQAGVYLLIGTDPHDGKPSAYIGEGEDVSKRLRQHRDKEFWVQLVVFVSKDENLTKAHIRYLEGRLIEEADKIRRYKLANDQTSGAKLPEADREDMEVFLSQVRQLLPILGCDILTPLVKTGVVSSQSPLFGSIKGLSSRGQRTAKGFVVFADSEAVTALRPSAPAYIIQARDKLKADGILVEAGGKLRFTRNEEFSSPSMAGAIICGGHVNGLTFWRDKDGRDLKEIEAGS